MNFFILMKVLAYVLIVCSFPKKVVLATTSTFTIFAKEIYVDAFLSKIKLYETSKEASKS